ncbi:MAG: hypothetical protein ACLPYS_12590 [Vulcanimicrobiaceae bacterium]|jgi:hypothetical protein
MLIEDLRDLAVYTLDLLLKVFERGSDRVPDRRSDALLGAGKPRGYVQSSSVGRRLC